MNRIYLAVLLLFILITPAFSQEPDSVNQATETVREFLPGDSLERYRSYDSARVEFDPHVRRSDSRRKMADSLVVEQPDFSHSTSKAIMYALVLPGLGQAYNKRYFKMPIVWAALGGVGYAIVFNTRNYQESSLDYSLTPDETNERYLRFWRRNLELSYIGLIAVYALQVVDAYVDAQLYSWDVNDNLSMRITPSLQPMMAPSSLTGQSYGLTWSFNLKGK